MVCKSITQWLTMCWEWVGGRGWERPANGEPFFLQEDDVLQLFRKFDANRPGTSW